MKNLSKIIEEITITKKSEWLRTLEEIKQINLEPDCKWKSLLGSIRNLILIAAEFRHKLDQDKTLCSFNLEELENLNHSYYAEILPGAKGYDRSYANPDLSVEIFGKKTGQLVSALYTHFRQYISSLSVENYCEALSLNLLFIELCKLSQMNSCDHNSVYNLFYNQILSMLENNAVFSIWQSYSNDFKAYNNIVETADYSDMRYLYCSGLYVKPEAYELAKFAASYPENELREIAAQHVAAYLLSFKRKKQDYLTKKSASIVCPMGLEKLAKFLADELRKAGLEPIISAPRSKPANEQYIYDNRFNSALYLDKRYAEIKIKTAVEAQNHLEEMIRQNSGHVIVWLFGEEPFVPTPKNNAPSLNDEQDQMQKTIQGEITRNFMNISPREKTSFSIISFPSTEIGDKFEDIFKDTLELNRLDGIHYAELQQKMIEILDKSEYVHVKGVSGNETDIKVQMQKVNNPETETLFENCVADVNIPVGEIFTTPKLAGTDGLLHVADIYLWNLRYYNLKIHFKNGMITDYSCTNFEDPEESRKYVFDNLLKPNKTLPIGEFAIGTNTKAYRMAKKYDIEHLLPILIIEKMGPHFAIGDTCYAYEEDSPHYALITNKLIIATDNEKSALRKTDPSQAYTFKHTDITLPYNMLAEITAVMPDGSRLPIIKDGLFAVPGTEELNEPLKDI